MPATLIGSTIGPYRIAAKLGEGGMGEVWRAHDSKLKRDVAIKVLPAAFVQDQERLARFEREAQLLAQLNHPNIAQIYALEKWERWGQEPIPANASDIGASKRESDPVPTSAISFLVMELVEGPTLADRLAQGALPIDEAFSLAKQIAEALEEAHEKGIVHRDLKPQNVKASIEGKAKVLDFGLAKAMDPTAGSVSVGGGDLLRSPTMMNSPTLTAAHGTQLGVILGTAAYMAPEQARGGAVDKRADVWAFGVVLFEMLTGRTLFAGETVSDTLAGVLKTEIDFSRLPAATPAPVVALLRRCLERNPKTRLRDIGEARIALERAGDSAEPAASAAAPARGSRTLERLAFGAGALLLAALAWSVGGRRAGEPASGDVGRFHLLPTENGGSGDGDVSMILSPDGRSVLLPTEVPDGRGAIGVRRLDSFEVRALPDTAGAYDPLWSPDGRSIAFFRGHLERIDAGGLGTPQKLAPVRDGRGAAWGPQGILLFAPDPAGVIYRVGAEGGEAVAVTRLDESRREIAHLRPSFLPDGRHFVYFARSEDVELSGLYVGSLDGQDPKRLLQLNVAALFAPPDQLLYVQNEQLVARRLDLDRLELVGEPVVIASGVDYDLRWDWLPVSASEQGRLVYSPKATLGESQVVRVARDGKRQATLGPTDSRNLDLAPDGRRLAVIRADPETFRPYVWILDLARDVAARFNPDAPANGPVWSPDGRRIAYVAVSSTDLRVEVQPAGGGPKQVIWRDPSLLEPVDWSPDGRWLLVEAASPTQRTDLLLVAADGSGDVRPFAASPSQEDSGRFSPDGRWVAFASDESGRPEIYVAPMPPTGEKWLVSRLGGAAPRWVGDGREIVYVQPGASREQMLLVSVSFAPHGDGPELGVPAPLGPAPSNDYEPEPGGREFLFSAPVADAVRPPPVLIENWTALLPRR